VDRARHPASLARRAASRWADTALVEFTDGPPVETRELDENTYLDLDADGRIVSLTIEHAQQTAGMDELST
jgi:uncharacterized protein YuzE